jgi:hypothetical protein
VGLGETYQISKIDQYLSRNRAIVPKAAEADLVDLTDFHYVSALQLLSIIRSLSFAGLQTLRWKSFVDRTI